jgi:uncharacterized caspase-like protein
VALCVDTRGGGEVQVTINGKRVGVDPAGNFAGVVPLTVGDNQIVVVARDRHANVTESTVSISRTPPVSQGVEGGPERRLALIIGNAAYHEGALRNAVNDATDMAATLERLGFVVTLVLDADQPAMERAIDVFTEQLHQAGVGLFYYAGHGVQVEGVNFLVPIGARLNAAADVKYKAVSAGWILERMRDAGTPVSIMILDACRDNPFSRQWQRFRSTPLPRDLAVVQAARGALVAYATEPDGVADDGTGRNGVYTKYLLRYMTVPGLLIQQMLTQVRVAVLHETAGKQMPWESVALTGDFYFAGRAVPKTAETPATTSGRLGQ